MGNGSVIPPRSRFESATLNSIDKDTFEYPSHEPDSGLVSEEFVSDYQNLRIWQQGLDLVDQVYILTEKFPKSEVFGLASQLRRAAVSVPSNIAEGNSSLQKSEYVRFLSYSIRSLAELHTQTIIAQRREFLSTDESRALTDNLISLRKQILALIRTLK